MITKAIFGIKYSYLSNEEILFIKKYHPYGIIFFERNIESINQFKSLINHIKRKTIYDIYESMCINDYIEYKYIQKNIDLDYYIYYS